MLLVTVWGEEHFALGLSCPGLKGKLLSCSSRQCLSVSPWNWPGSILRIGRKCRAKREILQELVDPWSACATVTQYSRLGGLWTAGIYFAQFWRLEVRNQGVNRVGFFWGRIYYLLLPWHLVVCCQSLTFLAYRCITLISPFIFRWLSLYACLYSISSFL